MLFARPPKLRLVPCELGQLVRKVVVDEFGELAAECGVQLTCESKGDAIVVSADETQLAVAIGAIVKNALEAANGGHVEVLVRRLPSGDAPMAEVLVRDDGPGISDQSRQHMFDPFFSGREAGRGLGFGASKCWRIVTDHGGQVVIHRCSAGAEVAIQLPLGMTNATQDAIAASS
jgi:C4-dicarboxylate-specific signal transduction histidine kinase